MTALKVVKETLMHKVKMVSLQNSEFENRDRNLLMAIFEFSEFQCCDSLEKIDDFESSTRKRQSIQTFVAGVKQLLLKKHELECRDKSI